MKIKSKALSVFVAMMLAVVGFCVAPTMAMADAGDVPAHGKTATPNDDGTYQLELSVTGDADNETQEAGGVNIVMVYDVSQSMTSNAGSSRYSRADQAEDIVHDFLTNLTEYQNTAKDNIRVSLVNFAVTGSQIQGWTTNVTGLANRFDDGGTDGQTSFNYNGYGTNWESALQQAQTLVNAVNNNDPVFVILMTDGAPTASGNGNNAIAPTGATIAQLRDRYNAATNEARSIATSCEATGGTFYGIYAYGTEADLLDDLMYYSKNNQHRGGSINNVVAATQEAPNYFNAAETSQLAAAIDEIFDKVVQAMGISSASISDGTTHEVKTSTDEISELLEVDTSSFKYWLSIPVVNNQFTRVDRDGNTITYTVSDDGKTVTWTEGGSTKSVDVNGEISGGQLKYEWTEKNDLYNYDPPAATFTDSKVDWDLKSVGTLLDGVTYSVTFDCYPSQTTLDIVADIKNDPGEDGAWSDLDPNIQQYITVDGRLQTNTTATLSYVDTRTGEPGSSEYTNPDPVASTAVEQMAITKDWNNVIDDREHPPVTLGVIRDAETEPHYSVTLSSDTGWQSSVFISVGIMRTNDEGELEVLEGANGHDFSFVEPEDLSYHWELNAPVVHPMMIDGVPTVLIKVDEKHPAPTGADTYTINGNEYYIDEETASLTATNDRRSRLFLTKKVEGDGAPADAKFPFTLNVVNPFAPEAQPTDEADPEHESDYWIWISARDKDGNPIEDVTGATRGTGSWWYAPSGKNVTILAPAGCSIMVNNLPTTATYTITEGDEIPMGFSYKETTLDIEGEGTGEPYELDRTTTGTIDEPNTEFTLTYTNKYEVVDVTVKKVWNDADDRDQLRPDELELTLNGLPDRFDAPDPEVTGTDTNTWTYTWTGLPKYDDEGEEIEYTVSEDTVPTGYECTGSPADPDGTITNKHTPVTVDANIAVTKALGEGSTWPDGKTLTFTLEGASNAPMPEETTFELDEAGDATFGPITYGLTDAGKTYTYTITEDGFGGGWTGDPEEITATVEIVKDDEGVLTANVTYSPEDATITNTYDATGEATIEVTKALADGSTWPEGKTLTFTLEGKDGAPVPEETTVELEAAGKVTFDPIPYTLEDAGQTYTYTITEDGFGDGWTGTPEEITATVTVTDNGSGTLVTEVTYSPEDATITNEYDAEGEGEITVTKALAEGSTWPEGETLTFTLTGTGSAPMPEETTFELSAAGDATFGPIPYTLEDAGKTYTYTISEGDGFGPAWDSTGDVTATVTVTDEGDGTLSTDVTYSPENATITNTYNPTPVSVDPPVQKIIVGKDDLYNKGDFTFTITNTAAPEGVTAPMPANTSITNSADYELEDKKGFYEFGVITFTAPGEYTYTVTESGNVPGVENDPDAAAGKSITFTVTEGDDGKLVVSPTTDQAQFSFTNEYKLEPLTLELSAGKKLDVEAPATNAPDVSGKYTLALTATGNAPLPEGATDGKVEISNVDGDGTMASFGEIEYAEPGEYQYTVTESGTVAGVTNGTASYTVVVNVTDKGDGTMEAEVTTGKQETLFTNTYKVTPGEASFEVTKVLTGTTLSAGQFEFYFEGSGDAPMPSEAADAKATNDADGKVEFKAITFDKPGTFTYTIKETNGGTESGGYTYDSLEVTATVTVTDNGEGELVAAVSYSDDTEFNNSYSASGEWDPSAQKKLTGTTLKEGDFTFQLLDENGEVLQEKKNSESGAVDFEPIEYTLDMLDSGSKKAKSASEESSSSSAADEKAAGEDGNNEQQSAAESGEAETQSDESAAQNAEGADAAGQAAGEAAAGETAGAEAAAAADGDAAASEGTPAGEAAPAAPTDEAAAGEPSAEGAPAAETAGGEDEAQAQADRSAVDAVNVNVAAAFAKPFFPAALVAGVEGADDVAEAAAEPAAELTTQADEKPSKTFKYTIREVPGSKAGVTYDTHEVTVEVTVTDKGDGTLDVKPVYSGSQTFTNTYAASGTVSFGGTKAVEGAELAEGQFSFQLKDSDNTVLQTKANDAEGNFEFDALEYDQDDAGKTFEYQIAEVNDGQAGYTYDSHVCKVTVSVEDNGDGTLTCTAELSDGDVASFVNPFKPLAATAKLEGVKVLEGRDLKAGEFEFELIDADGNIVKTTTNKADGTIDFGSYKFDEEGTYTYTAIEVEGDDENITYDTTEKTFTIEVKADGGQLVAAVSCDDGEAVEFVNEYEEPEEPDKPDKPDKPHKKVPHKGHFVPRTGDAAPMYALMAIALASGAIALFAGRRLVVAPASGTRRAAHAKPTRSKR